MSAARNATKSTLTHAPLLAAAAITLIPIAWMLCAAVKSGEDFKWLFLPRGDGFLGIAWDHLTFSNFTRLFGEAHMGSAILNSFFVSSVSAVVATLACAAGGFALARYRFRGRGPITVLVLGALIIPPPLLLAPTYELLYHLSLLDTFTGLLLPGIAPAFGVFLFRQATIQSVPRELLEAARIDGCGELRAFFVIVLPLLRPMIGAFMLITFLMWWNNFISPQVILQDPQKFPLAVAISQLKGVYYQDYGLQMAATVVSVAPVMILFLLLQKEFIAGLTAGAVKG
ncbi:MAG: carbohydrate ABC transporter permease [Phycisphaeraceae bacterium]|nr:MAG: carbohydrate ABC transporter permease [Phycisphaeraceae bacterium]